VSVDSRQTVAELRELAELTSDERGAQRVAWSPRWDEARTWFRAKLDTLPVTVTGDAAGNVWATLPGASPRSLVIGSHLDSVPDGGWLDGAMGLLAGLAVIRRLAAAGEPPPLTVRLVDWADEEGARFGRSVVGSGAATGSLDPEDLRELVDAEGTSMADALRVHGVELERMREARAELAGVAAYLELHIEQGPVLERMDLPLGVVSGGLGVRRAAVTFRGQAAHAGATPMQLRHDALLSAARLALEVREIARRHGGTGTTGRLDAEPGIVTAVAETATLLVDQRHLDADVLAAARRQAREAAAVIAQTEGTTFDWVPLQTTEPVEFDGELAGLADEVVRELAGASHRLPSGPLHDATEVARSGVPTALLFVRSIGGLSHTRLEDSHPEDIELGVRALDRLTDAALAMLAERA
jgi:beta-ureidopropionase / N-carbamoyl-L-amino-acid hydrolase